MISRYNNKQSEFQQELETLRNKIKKLHIKQADQAHLQEQVRKISTNILLFTNERLYLYASIKEGLNQLEKDIKKFEPVPISKHIRTNTQPVTPEVKSNVHYESFNENKTTPSKQESSGSSFFLLSFFRCCKPTNEKKKDTNVINDNTSSHTIPKLHSENKFTSALNTGLSYLSSLFCCFATRKKTDGYHPISTDEKAYVPFRK